MSSIEERLTHIQTDIADTASRCHRNPDDILLLAVSKGQPIAKLQEAYAVGQRHFGENYLQEAIQKQDELTYPDIVWHYIGQIQSNKTRDIAERFDWVHAVDSLKQAQRLSDQRPQHLLPLNICIAVNIDDNPKKSGVSIFDVAELVTAIHVLPAITLRGLMVLPDPRDNEKAQLAAFQTLTDCLVHYNAEHDYQLDTLSMGMSSDYHAAIKAGSTIVRIGTQLFGPREVRK